MVGSWRKARSFHRFLGLSLTLVFGAPRVIAAIDSDPRTFVTQNDATTTDTTDTASTFVTREADVLATYPRRPFSAAQCQTVTRRPVDDIILGDPNSLAQGHPQGVHLSLGETLCITGKLESGGRLNQLVVLRDEVTEGPVIALRMLESPQGTELQIATTSDSILHYEAYIQVDSSRLVVATHTLPVRPNGFVSHESWPTKATELWLSEMRFVPVVKPKYSTPNAFADTLKKGPAERRWGMDFWLTTGISQANFTELNRTLAKEGYGQFPNTYGTLGFDIGAFYRRFRLGLFLRGTPNNLARGAQAFPIHGSVITVGPYLGFDFLRYRALTSNFRLEYVATDVGMSEAAVLPSFARTNASFYRITHSTGGLGLTVSQELAIPFYTSEGGQIALGLRTEIGYVFELHENAYWSYENAQGQIDGPRIIGGPRMDTSGWHVGLHLGVPVYVF